MPKNLVTIKTRTVGDNFATEGVVLRKGHVLYRTREYPLDHKKAAYQAAEMHALSKGWTIRY